VNAVGEQPGRRDVCVIDDEDVAAAPGEGAEAVAAVGIGIAAVATAVPAGAASRNPAISAIAAGTA